MAFGKSWRLTGGYCFIFQNFLASIIITRMNQGRQTRKLWEEIGVYQSQIQEGVCLSEENIREGNIFLETGQLKKGYIPQQTQKSEQRSYKSYQFKNVNAERFQKMMQNLNVQVLQVNSYKRISNVNGSNVELALEYPNIEMSQVRQVGNGYNQNIGFMVKTPFSFEVPPNAIAISQKRSSEKMRLKTSSLALNIGALREQLTDFHCLWRDFSEQFQYIQINIQEQFKLRLQILNKHHSRQLQKERRKHRQEYQQLKYEYQLYRQKQNVIQSPVKSEFYIPEKDTNSAIFNSVQELKINQELKIQIQVLEEEREGLLDTIDSLNRELGQRKDTFAQLKRSNDKLEEYIFDLQQQVAYQKEEIPQITRALKDDFNAQLKAVSEEKQQIEEQLKQALRQIVELKQTKKKLDFDIREYQEKIQKIKMELQQQSKARESLYQQVSFAKQTMEQLKREGKSKELQFRQMLQEKDVALKQRSNDYIKEDVQNNYGQRPAMISNFPTSYSIQDECAPQRHNKRQQVPRNDYTNKQIIHYKTYQREYEYPQENQYIPKMRCDDYGMQNYVRNRPKIQNVERGRENNYQFCTRETQAIIQKVRQKQQKRDNGCHLRCENIGKCRCDVLSRGSRTSQNSSSKDYYQLKHYRPNHISPVSRPVEHSHEKSAKMQAIEQKVKRLKTQLKSSLTTMRSE